MGEDKIRVGNLTVTLTDLGGVVVAARTEGLCRNWGGPPGLKKKDLGAG